MSSKCPHTFVSCPNCGGKFCELCSEELFKVGTVFMILDISSTCPLCREKTVPEYHYRMTESGMAVCEGNFRTRSHE